MVERAGCCAGPWRRRDAEVNRSTKCIVSRLCTFHIRNLLYGQGADTSWEIGTAALHRYVRYIDRALPPFYSPPIKTWPDSFRPSHKWVKIGLTDCPHS